MLTALTSNPTFMLDAVLRLIERRNSATVIALEESIGYRLVFSNIPEGWIQGVASVDLSASWRRGGLDVAGIDYFTMGAIAGSVSTRFDTGSDQFQSWIGGYLVALGPNHRRTLEENLQLANIDQLNWLGHYGDPSPSCQLTTEGFQPCGAFSVSGYSGQLYVGGGSTHTDIGKPRRKFWRALAAKFVALSFLRNSSKLDLTAAELVPRRETLIYADIALKGYIACIPIQANVVAVLYANGTIFTDELGKRRNTFEALRETLLKALKRIEIRACTPTIAS